MSLVASPTCSPRHHLLGSHKILGDLSSIKLGLAKSHKIQDNGTWHEPGRTGCEGVVTPVSLGTTTITSISLIPAADCSSHS